MAKDDYESSWPACSLSELWGWVSFEACARACLLGVTSEGWSDHEIFSIVADSICREGPVEAPDPRSLEKPAKTGVQPKSLDLVKEHWPGTKFDPTWWLGNDRRGFWDCSKAKVLLGWDHETR